MAEVAVGLGEVLLEAGGLSVRGDGLVHLALAGCVLPVNQSCPVLGSPPQPAWAASPRAGAGRAAAPAASRIRRGAPARRTAPPPSSRRGAGSPSCTPYVA